KIAIGAYSPLEGFMDAETVESVGATGRLPNGLPWSIPIHFPVPADPAAASVRPGDDVGLKDDRGRLVAILHVDGIFPLDRLAMARATYGTEDPNHPNVADLLAGSPNAWSGTVDLVRRLVPPWDRAEPTPAETRTEFGRRGWRRVAGYQCRNPPHTAHEYIQRLTLEREDVDGLLIHPVVGRLKKGDYRPAVILEAYDALVRNYYPEDRVMLSPLTITMRYGGPKAALFLAIVRRNYGCALYIVGRDQAGVGKYYHPTDCHRIFDAFDIGVVPVRYDESFFCRRCGWMASGKTCAHPASERAETSQSRIREALATGAPLPPEILRPEVADVLRRPDVTIT
ncbi:sulfate adenylyltransferase, partial [mine drainage metagenome]